MYLEGIEKKAQEMTVIYKIIHKVVIKYGIFFVTIIGAIYRGQIIINKDTNIISLNDGTTAEKELQIKQFKNNINKIQGTGEITVFVGLGTFEREKDILASYNNLMSYNGYTLPRYFEGDISPFKDKNILEGNITSKEELESFIVNLLSIKNKDRLIKATYKPIEIKDTTVSTFNLQCLSQNKIYNGLCNIFTDNFVKTFMLYDINTDIEGFKDIMTILINNNRSKYQNEICTNLVYYAYYSENTSSELKNIMKLCPNNYYDTFNKFSLYYEIQKELENKFISNTVYSDTIVNEYKIRSFLQIIYEDLNNKKISLDRINIYLDFLEELLKKEKLSILDTNIIYYFNNYNLKLQIQNPELFMKVDNKSELNTILKRINNINNGNILIGYKGLNYKVNENIMIKENEVENGIIEQNYSEIIAKLLDQISNFSIDEKQISGNQVLAKGVLTIQSVKKNNIYLPMKARFQEQSSVLYIKRVNIEGEGELNNNINAIIETQERSFGDLQRYLNDNRNVLITIPQEEIPSDIGEESFCKTAETSMFEVAFIERCNEEALGVSFTTKENKKVGININYENYVFKNIEVSDPIAKTQISSYLTRPEIIAKYKTIDNRNLIKFLLEIVNLVKDQAGNGSGAKIDFTASDNTIIVIEAIKKYLGVTISDIVEKNNKIAITFIIGNITLIGNYNISSHTLEQLYFKDVKVDGIPVLIKNTQILLDDSNIEEIKKFRKDPLAYFSSKSIENQLIYLKYGPK